MLKIADNCISCGRCSEDCPSGIIYMEDGTPTMSNPKFCIKCDHCEAVCPVNALTNLLMDKEEPINLEKALSPESAEMFLRSRRSARVFKKEKVDKELLVKLVDIGRYAPTPNNIQGISYMVISDEELIKKLEDLLIEEYAASDEKAMNSISRRAAKLREEGKSVLFRGAHQLILVLGEAGSDRSLESARISATYIELFAPTLGLGTCWVGYIEPLMQNNSPKLRELLDLPEGIGVHTVLLVGHPKFQYQRLAKRNAMPDVLWK